MQEKQGVGDREGPIQKMRECRVRSRGSQRDVVYLGWPVERPRVWAQMRGGDGLRVWANEYDYSHGVQINFGDLTPFNIWLGGIIDWAITGKVGRRRKRLRRCRNVGLGRIIDWDIIGKVGCRRGEKTLKMQGCTGLGGILIWAITGKVGCRR
jgi:hypothetical protein